ncbi:MAG: hypothetical protein J6252_00555, partial [Clostridia bacterium]|nr:hypothetical protein [Clostridia bacterium]
DSITVSGSPAAIDSIRELVLRIDETTVDGQKTFEFPIGSLLPAGVSNESGISKITVEVAVPGMALRKYTPAAGSVEILNLPRGASFEVLSMPEITVMGALDAFEDFEPDSITAQIDYARLRMNPGGSYSAEPAIRLGDAAGLYVLKPVGEIEFAIELPESGETSEPEN